jgi:hypothetical protein
MKNPWLMIGGPLHGQVVPMDGDTRQFLVPDLEDDGLRVSTRLYERHTFILAGAAWLVGVCNASAEQLADVERLLKSLNAMKPVKFLAVNSHGGNSEG